MSDTQQEEPVEYCNEVVTLNGKHEDGDTIEVFATCKRLLGHDDDLGHNLEIQDERENTISNITWTRNSE